MNRKDEKIKFPPLIMGTVALGISYGVFEGQKRPDMNDSLSMLSKAYSQGITCFDTAREYGDAEAIIGDFIIQNTLKPLVVSKFKLSNNDLKNKTIAKRKATLSLEESMKVLKLDVLPILLFHNQSDLDQKKVRNIIPGILEDFKRSGLISHAGLSIDHPSEMKAFIDVTTFEIYQIPINVFDQRLIQDRMLEQLLKYKKTVIARSVFLKGMLLQDPMTLKGNLVEARAPLIELNQLADKAQMSIAQFCFSYVRDLEAVSSIVFGAENEAQIFHNLQMFNGPVISDELRKEAELKFKSISELILTPRLWKMS